MKMRLLVYLFLHKSNLEVSQYHKNQVGWLIFLLDFFF